MNECFHALTGYILNPRSIRIDCEVGVYKSMREIFGPLVKIRLCTVHIQRACVIEKISEMRGKSELCTNKVVKKHLAYN